VTQVRLAAIPEIDPRLKCKTVKLYDFCFQAIDSQWDIFGNRKILRFPIFLRQEIESRKSRGFDSVARSREAGRQAFAARQIHFLWRVAGRTISETDPLPVAAGA
jgi:hypothetical protein